MTIPSKEFKRRARAVLTGKYSIAVSLSTTLILAVLAMSFLLQHTGFGESPQLMHQIFFWCLWAIMAILGALLEVGLMKFLYTLSKEHSLSTPFVIFYAFQNQPDTFILTTAVRYLAVLIWFVPALLKALQLPLLTMTIEELVTALLPILGLALIAVIPATLLALPFCLTNYVLLDEPYMSAHEALFTSIKLIKGQKKRVFFLWLSFLPLCLASLGSYGVGFLWLLPYYHATMSQFYLELTGQVPEPKEESAPTPDAFQEPEI